jgi:SAM-dependent methyltransferase
VWRAAGRGKSVPGGIIIKTLPKLPSAFYDDQDLNYLEYWTSRGYEHDAEVMALRRLLDGQRFRQAIDIGGGYGRLSVILADYADRVALVDSSQQQLDLADDYLGAHPQISRHQMEASSLRLPDGCADLVSMVRVLHHLPDPTAELRELHRVLKPGGLAIIEVANVAHAMNRLRYLLRRRPIPLSAVDIRSAETRQRHGIPFVNHHPAALVGRLQSAGLHLERMLSVSNLRHPAFKRLIPGPALLAAERQLQHRIAPMYFGPSMFLLLRRA